MGAFEKTKVFGVSCKVFVDRHGREASKEWMTGSSPTGNTSAVLVGRVLRELTLFPLSFLTGGIVVSCCSVRSNANTLGKKHKRGKK